MRYLRGLVPMIFLGLGLLLMPSAIWALSFSQVNLVSDIPGLAALTDPNLRNPWGVSFTSASPLWTSNQGSSTADLFTIRGFTVTQNALEVTIPTTAAGPQGPTGQVNNNTSSFPVNGTPANFIFASLNGTISAWNNSAGTTAQIKVTTPQAVYTGLAIGSNAWEPSYTPPTTRRIASTFSMAHLPM